MAMINAYTTSFLSENLSFWFQNKQEKKDGISCSPARGTEGSDLLSLRHSPNCGGQNMSLVGWALTSTLFMHFELHYLPAKRKVRLLFSFCRTLFYVSERNSSAVARFKLISHEKKLTVYNILGRGKKPKLDLGSCCWLIFKRGSS